MNAFETNDFFKNHSHLDSKKQKSRTRTTLYFNFVVREFCIRESPGE